MSKRCLKSHTRAANDESGEIMDSLDVKSQDLTNHLCPLYLPSSAILQLRTLRLRDVGKFWGSSLAEAEAGQGPGLLPHGGGWVHSQSASWVASMFCANQDAKGQ